VCPPRGKFTAVRSILAHGKQTSRDTILRPPPYVRGPGLMNILTPRLEFVVIPDAVIRKSTLPHRKLRIHPMRETSFDEAHHPLDRGALRGQQNMDLIWHDDKSVQLVVSLWRYCCSTSRNSSAFAATWNRRRRLNVALVTK
jgi:hypothetical protein